MADLNRVYLMGNLTKDPEIRYTSSGKPVGDLRMAITTKFKESEDTCFVSVTVWDRQAETCGEYLSKGSPVLVEVSLQLDEWKTKEGEARSKLRVRAARVQFLGSPRGQEFRDGEGAPAARDPGPRQPEPRGDEIPPPEDGPGDDDNLPF